MAASFGAGGSVWVTILGTEVSGRHWAKPVGAKRSGTSGHFQGWTERAHFYRPLTSRDVVGGGTGPRECRGIPRLGPVRLRDTEGDYREP